MMEASLMMAKRPELTTPWMYVGYTAAYTSALDYTALMHTNTQPGDLVVAFASVSGDAMGLRLVNRNGWHTFGFSHTDYLVAKRVTQEDLVTRAVSFTLAASRTVRYVVATFRNPGWRTIKMWSNTTPYTREFPVITKPNTLVLVIGLTPGNPSSFVDYIDGKAALNIYTTSSNVGIAGGYLNIPLPKTLGYTYADAGSGAERSLIFMVS